MEYLWLIIGWIIYFLIHSLLAIRQVKSYALSHGISAQYYRLAYNLIALITLIPILIISTNIQSDYALMPNKTLKFSGLILAGYGVVLAKRAFKSYDTKAFLGLGPLQGEAVFKTDGLLRHVRHPLYSASMLILAGYFLFDPKWNTLFSVSMMTLYFIVGSYFEERKLIREFGQKYMKYKQQTPMFIPKFWRRA
jgi:protein-S-isoprenylcysteine O-methyltransferase Ste14